MDTIAKANRVVELVGIINEAERELKELLPPDREAPAAEISAPVTAVAEPGTAQSTGGPVKVPLACCGSMAAKHKATCPVRHPERAADYQQPNRAPVIDGKWRCNDCMFRFDSKAAKLDVTCPKCGGIHVSDLVTVCGD
jgi:hypothetical protein